eukprot:CAMPEP_0174261536 /NCGR_PEP_ID=MMETSP0439-20130205/11488_1 /TAXON_ID=0 /ORGANISM="Stereomyxa ramosa, Strain Chinc5" /LENGTH=109 /DNA_ID=CAMNT_0015346021 /DNA_START=39 /DNA_END=368 /DNA_ORIENTATION=-
MSEVRSSPRTTKGKKAPPFSPAVSAPIRKRRRKKRVTPRKKVVKRKRAPRAPKNKLYEVETIVDSKVIYLVKWKGYPDSQNTWEDASNLSENCPDLFREFIDNERGDAK